MPKKDEDKFLVSETGKVGVTILSELMDGIKKMKMIPVGGYIDIKVITAIEDDNIWTKEGEESSAQIHVHIDIEDLKETLDEL